jgi:hypothetical protein
MKSEELAKGQTERWINAGLHHSLKEIVFHISWHLLSRAASAQITSMIDIKKYLFCRLEKVSKFTFYPLGSITRDQ